MEGDVPNLLQSVLKKDPQVFHGNPHIDGMSSDYLDCQLFS